MPRPRPWPGVVNYVSSGNGSITLGIAVDAANAGTKHGRRIYVPLTVEQANRLITSLQRHVDIAAKWRPETVTHDPF